ncbi:MAG: SDR family oxidoreductase [Hyphomicrobium sp.]
MRTVLITGTSAGFGLVTAVELAKRGWRVIASMRNLDRRGPLDAALIAAGAAPNVDIIQLDVNDANSIAQGVEAMLAVTGGTLDAVVHNAGVAAGGAFEDIPEAELRRVMETNFFGVMTLTRALLPTFRKQRAGRIVIVSSESAFHGQPGNSIYVASKWAVEGWAESLAYDVEQFGIKVLLIEPGPYVTDIYLASDAAVRAVGQRLPAMEREPVPGGRCACGQERSWSAGGRDQDRRRSGGEEPILPQPGAPRCAFHAFCAGQSSQPLDAQVCRDLSWP